MKGENKVRKVYRSSDLGITAAFLAVGAVLTIFVPSCRWLGILLLISGVIMLPTLKTGYRIPGTDGIFIKKEHLLPRECRAEIISYMADESVGLDIDPFAMGGLLMETYSNADGSMIFAQLFSYETCVYSSLNDITRISREQFDNLMKFADR